MTPRAAARTATCGVPQARVRRDQARKFYEVADLVEGETATIPSAASVAASLAVLAGIAAADAACCAQLKRRSRGQDHKQAVDLVRTVHPGGDEASKKLDRLLDLKDAAHYGVIHVSGQDLQAALRSAKSLVSFAEDVVRRNRSAG